jgi:hypothetical protein
MNDSITGVTSCPDNVRPGAANGALNRFAGRETQPVSGWMGVASIQPGCAVGYLFVVCIALTDRCEDLSSQLLYRQHCNNRSIMRSQASNWSSAMNSSGLWP